MILDWRNFDKSENDFNILDFFKKLDRQLRSETPLYASTSCCLQQPQRSCCHWFSDQVLAVMSICLATMVMVTSWGLGLVTYYWKHSWSVDNVWPWSQWAGRWSCCASKLSINYDQSDFFEQVDLFHPVSRGLPGLFVGRLTCWGLMLADFSAGKSVISSSMALTTRERLRGDWQLIARENHLVSAKKRVVTICNFYCLQNLSQKLWSTGRLLWLFESVQPEFEAISVRWGLWFCSPHFILAATKPGPFGSFRLCAGFFSHGLSSAIQETEGDIQMGRLQGLPQKFFEKSTDPSLHLRWKELWTWKNSKVWMEPPPICCVDIVHADVLAMCPWQDRPTVIDPHSQHQHSSRYRGWCSFLVQNSFLLAPQSWFIIIPNLTCSICFIYMRILGCA